MSAMKINQRLISYHYEFSFYIFNWLIPSQTIDPSCCWHFVNLMIIHSLVQYKYDILLLSPWGSITSRERHKSNLLFLCQTWRAWLGIAFICQVMILYIYILWALTPKCAENMLVLVAPLRIRNSDSTATDPSDISIIHWRDFFAADPLFRRWVSQAVRGGPL